jgi:hypothetical protein
MSNIPSPSELQIQVCENVEVAADQLVAAALAAYQIAGERTVFSDRRYPAESFKLAAQMLCDAGWVVECGHAPDSRKPIPALALMSPEEYLQKLIDKRFCGVKIIRTISAALFLASYFTAVFAGTLFFKFEVSLFGLSMLALAVGFWRSREEIEINSRKGITAADMGPHEVGVVSRR